MDKEIVDHLIGIEYNKCTLCGNQWSKGISKIYERVIPKCQGRRCKDKDIQVMTEDRIIDRG